MTYLQICLWAFFQMFCQRTHYMLIVKEMSVSLCHSSMIRIAQLAVCSPEGDTHQASAIPGLKSGCCTNVRLAASLYARCCCLSVGMRYNPSSAGQPKGCPLCNIGCAFNQQRLYANLQASDGLAAASYTLEDTGRWRELAVHAQDLVGAPGIRFDLHVGCLGHALFMRRAVLFPCAAHLHIWCSMHCGAHQRLRCADQNAAFWLSKVV